MPAALSLSIGSAFNQYLLVDIRAQASKEEITETDFALGGIRSHSEPGFDEDVHDRSFGSACSITATAS